MQQRREELRVVPSAPVFYPTLEEFRDPLAFISVIRPAAEPYGIAKVVPPPGAWPRGRERGRIIFAAVGTLARPDNSSLCRAAGWRQAFSDPLSGSGLDFETKQQHIHKLQEGQPFGEVCSSVEHAPPTGACPARV
jgi:hypothetical protein